MYYRVTETYDDDLYTDATVINMGNVMSFMGYNSAKAWE